MHLFHSLFLFLWLVLVSTSIASTSEGGEGSCVSGGNMNSMRRMSTSILSTAIVRGPSPGGGRNAWVKYNGLVWTVGMPGAKKTPDMDAKAQTELALTQIDERLAQAGITRNKASSML